jgi:hypothetical protein
VSKFDFRDMLGGADARLSKPPVDGIAMQRIIAHRQELEDFVLAFSLNYQIPLDDIVGILVGMGTRTAARREKPREKVDVFLRSVRATIDGIEDSAARAINGR